MLKSIIVYTQETDSVKAGSAMGEEIRVGFAEQSPHAVVVFASARYDYGKLLAALKESCSPEILIGCSSAGEFVSGEQGVGSACAMALHSNEMQFGAGIGRGLNEDRAAAATELTSSFQGLDQSKFGFRSAIVLTDALAGYTEDFVKQLTLRTGGMYQFIGGGAGDDAQFRRTHVFYGTESVPDAAVALEILSNKPIGMGVAHGWKPASAPLRVTEASGMRLISLNSMTALEAVAEFAGTSDQSFNPKDPLPFFLHNVIGIDAGNGNYRLRVPLAVNDDGSISCASDIPEGAMICFMKATNESAVAAAKSAAHAAIDQLEGNEPGVALFFDCVATRLRMGSSFDFELQSIQKILGETRFVGANTYGQIARVEGQFSGFHNCTATVCVLPR